MNKNSVKIDLCQEGTMLKFGGNDVCEACIVNGKCHGGYINPYP